MDDQIEELTANLPAVCSKEIVVDFSKVEDAPSAPRLMKILVDKYGKENILKYAKIRNANDYIVRRLHSGCDDMGIEWVQLYELIEKTK